MTCLTFFFSTHGLENWAKAQFADFLEREGVVSYLDGDPKVSAMPLSDASGNDLWSVTLIVGIDSETYVDDRSACVRTGHDRPLLRNLAEKTQAHLHNHCLY